MITHRPLPRLVFGQSRASGSLRELPEEVAVALSYNGSTRAVMMATPADLVDFAYGFSITEGIATPDQIESVEVVETALGIDLQIWLTPDAEAREVARRRSMGGPVGCGLCAVSYTHRDVYKRQVPMMWPRPFSPMAAPMALA